MTAIITSRLKVFAAEQLRASFTDATSKHYLFIGKSLPWTNDVSPDVPVDSHLLHLQARRDMLAAKRIQGTDTSLGIINRAWVTGRYYDMYRHDYDGVTTGVDLITGAVTTPDTLWEANFFVETDDYNIYKCIYNGGGVVSTVKPTGTAVTQFSTADGYVWKYMGSVPPSSATKFQTNNFAPVKRVGANPGSSDPYYTQYLVEQAAVNGAINFIRVSNIGTGYTANATNIPVTITGDGTGATAVAVANASGRISSITITAAGTGYTWANVTIGGTGSGATATAIISPQNGHGYDITRELGAYYLILDVQLSYDEGTGDFPVGNSFRRVGIVRDPFLNATTTVATGTTYRTNPLLTFTTATGTFVANETITGGTSGATGVVVSYDSTNKQVRYYQTSTNSGTFAVAETVTGGTSGASGVITTKSNSEIDNFSGEILYVEHRRPTIRAIDQIEDIKVVLEA